MEEEQAYKIKINYTATRLQKAGRFFLTSPGEQQMFSEYDLTYPLLEEREMEKNLAKIVKSTVFFSSVGAEGG